MLLISNIPTILCNKDESNRNDIAKMHIIPVFMQIDYKQLQEPSLILMKKKDKNNKIDIFYKTVTTIKIRIYEIQFPQFEQEYERQIDYNKYFNTLTKILAVQDIVL